MKLIIVHKNGKIEEFDNLDSVEGAPSLIQPLQVLLLRKAGAPTEIVPLDLDR